MESIKAIVVIKDGLIKSIVENDKTIIITENEKYEFDGYILPSLVDSHCHLYGLGKFLNGINLDSATSAKDCIEIANKSKFEKGQWIIGRGWNQENWNSKKFPTKKLLDDSFPNNPVCFIRVDGHSIWVNSFALELANINSKTENPNGGEIRKYKTGKPNGLLIDNAIDMVYKVLPKETKELKIKYILDAIDDCISKGISEVHDMDVDLDLLSIYKELDNENKLKIRINSYISAQNKDWQSYIQSPYKGKMFNVIGLKFFADGALGSRGALLLDDYSDDKGNKGLKLITKEELYAQAKIGLENNWQIAIHAIGDAANRNVIDIFERLRNEGYQNLFRIEHAQIVHNNDLPRLSKSDIFAAVQPIHFVSDAKMMIKRLGIRANYAYPWKSLIDNNITFGGGSDFPVETNNPWKGISAFINRIPQDEENPWFGEERISLDDAFKAYTIDAHKIAGFNNRGLVKENYLADLIILDKDLSDISKAEIGNVVVEATFVDGKLGYLKNEN